LRLPQHITALLRCSSSIQKFAYGRRYTLEQYLPMPPQIAWQLPDCTLS
jgi:hypothetical protein